MTHIIEEFVSSTRELPEQRRAELKRELLTQIARHDRRHRNLRIGAGVGGAAAVAVSTATFVLSSSPAATAVWSAVPAPESITSHDPLVQRCLADLPGAPAQQLGRAELTPVVAERRGTSRAALLGGGDSQAICIATPTSRTGGRTSAPVLARGQDITLSGDGGSTDASSGYRYVYGRVSSRVATVSVTTSSGLRVTSSVAHGAYVAWWPGGANPATITAVDASGNPIATVKPTTG